MTRKETIAKIVFTKGALKALDRVARETDKQRCELEALLRLLRGQKEATK